jgi:hypothetical protein
MIPSKGIAKMAKTKYIHFLVTQKEFDEISSKCKNDGIPSISSFCRNAILEKIKNDEIPSNKENDEIPSNKENDEIPSNKENDEIPSNTDELPSNSQSVWDSLSI